METIRLVYPVEGGDLIEAGEASSKMKLTLKKLGLPQDVIRRASICMYEGEINMVIHADGGQCVGAQAGESHEAALRGLAGRGAHAGEAADEEAGDGGLGRESLEDLGGHDGRKHAGGGE